jgi:hypothetical protein
VGRAVAPRSPPCAGAAFWHTLAHGNGGGLELHRRRAPSHLDASGHRLPSSNPEMSNPEMSSSYCMDRSPGGGGGRSGRSHSFRWRRIFSMTAPSPIRLRILSGAQQRGQTRGSASQTFLINRAHERLRLRRNSSALSGASCWAGFSADGRAHTAAERDTRRALEKAPQYVINCCPQSGTGVHKAARKSSAGRMRAAEACASAHRWRRRP